MADGLMLAVVKENSSPGVAVKQVPIPSPKKDEALVKIKATSICGTDLGVYNWNLWARSHLSPPKVLGHEIVGEVVEVNSDITELKSGDLVSSETHIYCDNCQQCKAGNRHVCENMLLFGISRDGGFAQYATIPLKTVWKNDPALSLEAMVVQEPLGNAVHAVTKAGVEDKVVGIFGLGPIGICAGLVAKEYGAKRIFAVEPSKYRRELAQKMGILEVYPSFRQNLSKQADVVFEMSGSEVAINSSLETAKAGGKIMIFGIPKDAVNIDLGKYIINKELTLKGVFGRKIWETWAEVGRLLKNGLNIEPLITHKFKLSEFEKAIETIKSGECGKILLQP